MTSGGSGGSLGVRSGLRGPEGSQVNSETKGGIPSYGL